MRSSRPRRRPRRPCGQRPRRTWTGPLYEDRTLVRTWAARGTLHLLPAFDPCVVGSPRQLDVVSTGPRAAVSRPQGWIAPTLVVDGRIEGTWAADPKTGAITVTPFGRISAAVRRALSDVII